MHSTKRALYLGHNKPLIMSYNTQNTGIEFSYLAVLLLLAYVMSSAPKYVRQFRENHEDIKIEKVSPFQQVLKIGKYYTVDPYIRTWKKLSPGSSNNIATVQNPGLR